MSKNVDAKLIFEIGRTFVELFECCFRTQCDPTVSMFSLIFIVLTFQKVYKDTRCYTSTFEYEYVFHYVIRLF